MSAVQQPCFRNSAARVRLWLIVLFIGAVPAANIAYLVLTYGVDVPYMDDWEYVPFIDGSLRGDWSIGNLFAQHNEHRPALFRTWRMLSAWLFEWNLFLELALSVVIAAATYLIIAREMIRSRRLLGEGLSGSIRLLVLASLLLLSPTQWESFLWAHQLSWFLQNGFAVACLALLARPPGSWPQIAFAISFGLCSTFSHGGGGLVLWPVGALFCAISCVVGERRQGETTRLFIWTLASVMVLLAYFHGYQRPEHHASLSHAVEKPLDLAAYVSAFLGNAVFFENTRLAIASGAVVIGLFLAGFFWSIRMKGRFPMAFEAAAFWALLGAFGGANALVTGLARSGFGLEQALSSRYVAMGTLFWIGSCALTDIILAVGGWTETQVRQKRRTVPASLLVVAVAGAAIVSYAKVEPVSWLRFHNRLTIGRDTLLYRNNDADLVKLHHSIGHVLAFLPVLERNRLSLFRNADALRNYKLHDAGERLAGRVDSWGDDMTPGETTVEGCGKITGWAVDPESARPARKIFVIRGREVVAAAPVRELRPDVAEKLGSPETIGSGWSVTICGKRLGKGEPTLSIYAQPNSQPSLVKIGEHRLNVKSLAEEWGSGGEVVFDATPETCARSILPVHESDVECGGRITLVSHGRDPYFVTSPLALDPSRRCVLKMELFLDHEDILRVYAGRPGSGFRDSDAQRFTLFPGINVIFADLPNPGTISGLVFAPGSREGLYELEGFTLKQFAERDMPKQ
ncbi:MAG: hypothetical protein LDL33_04275 [Desulfomonile sp.]|nr:hypothetical protein [Desulfomonile sp.]